jgi:polyhydroxyalkanoate synthesis regulator protein
MASPQKADHILIKRHGRSRLYDTFHGRYLSTEDLRQWISERINFIVVDTETGVDVTRVLLA